jgi:hypothetical protein
MAGFAKVPSLMCTVWWLLLPGHKVKNPKMKLVQELRKLPVTTRVIISGTPIQVKHKSTMLNGQQLHEQ